MKTPIKTAGILFAAVVLHSTSAAFAGAIEPRLWIIDAGTEINYELTINSGVTLISSFPGLGLGNAKSGLAIDPYDRTLWGLSEQTIALPRGSVVNYTRGGALLSVISAVTFGGFSLEGVAADYYGDSLWVVDDPIGVFPGEVPTVYHIEKDGTIIDSFATSTYDPDAKSPQAIAVDPFDGTLWLTNNSRLNDTIYHIERDGDLISSFGSATYDVSADNPQGITVDESNHTLWVTDLLSDRIYNITTTGDLISSFQNSEVDINAFNVMAIAYDSVSSVPEPATFTIFALGLAGLGILRRRRAA